MKKITSYLIILLIAILAISSITVAATEKIAAVRAVDYVNQGGGEVQSPSGRAYPTLSHWDYVGHWLEWQIDIPENGTYIPVAMYGTGNEYADRQLSIDGEHKLDMLFFSTGDFQVYDIGYFNAIDLTAGEQIIRLTVSGSDGVHAGVNPAWIAFIPLELLFELTDDQIISIVEEKLGF